MATLIFYQGIPYSCGWAVCHSTFVISTGPFQRSSACSRLFSWAVWHSCRMGARNQEQTRGRIGPQFRLGNLRVGELHFCPLCTAPGPVLDFGPERGPGKGTMADLGPLIRHLVSTRLPSGGRAAFLSPLSPLYGSRPSV